MRFLGRRSSRLPVHAPKEQNNDDPSGGAATILTPSPPSISDDNAHPAITLAPPLIVSSSQERFTPRSSFDAATSLDTGVKDQPQPRLSPLAGSLGARLSLLSINIFSSRSSSKSPDRQVTPANAKSSDDISKDHLNVPSSTSALKRRLSKRAKKRKNESSQISHAALSVKDMLSGSSSAAKSPHGGASAASKPHILNVQKALLDSEAANHIITGLRHLSPYTNDVNSSSSVDAEYGVHEGVSLPVHGVCLDLSDEDVDCNIFSRLASTAPPDGVQRSTSMASTPKPSPPTSVLLNLQNLHLIDLFKLGPLTLSSSSADTSQPSDPLFGIQILPPTAVDFRNAGGDATLYGALPSPGTISDGMNHMASQFLALGLSDPSASPFLPRGPGSPSAQIEQMLPSHTGVYPPLDRMSCITYWWGYELLLPEPSIVYLGRVKSIGSTLINFLTAFAFLDGGIREIMPFIRYASQFVDWEWNLIRSKDQGKGVVCAATWVMPAALMPRPWDFPPPPPPHPRSTSAMTKGIQLDPTSIGRQSLDASLPPLPPTPRASLPGHALVASHPSDFNRDGQETAHLGGREEEMYDADGYDDGDGAGSAVGDSHTAMAPIPALTLTHPTLPRGFGISHNTIAVPAA